MSPSTTSTVYPLSAVRSLALHLQGLSVQNEAQPRPTLERIYETVENVGCVQIDTLQMVQRSHYIALWSRLGKYDPACFDSLVYDPKQRRLFEYWGHAAAIIPLNEFRYYLPRMRYFREGHSTWNEAWRTQPGNADLVEGVLERVRQNGAMRAADFEHNGTRRGTWWDWKPAKRALEILYDSGDLMISGRVNFQRVYDLQERVLPAWVDRTEPTQEEAHRHFVERAGLALGACLPVQVADYAYLKRTTVKPHLEALINEGVFIPVMAHMVDGEAQELIIHRDNMALLEQAAAGDLPARRTTFLSFFDSLFWARGRDMQFWSFRNMLEAYKRAPDRIYGYFCLPILHRDQLVGRFDPKLDRKAKTLRLKALYLEPDVEPGEELAVGMAGALHDFLAFHQATDVVIERSQPDGFGSKVLRAM